MRGSYIEEQMKRQFTKTIKLILTITYVTNSTKECQEFKEFKSNGCSKGKNAFIQRVNF